MANSPDSELAARVLPPPLYRAVRHVFGQGPAGCMLVGGTALAGYYAGHRRSDDLDLFVRDAPALSATILAVESLSGLGTVITARQKTPQFYDSVCQLEGHSFTVQVVLDPNVFVVGTFALASDGVAVADLQTLLKQKSATLVSRCSEKDLFDLAWLFDCFPGTTFDQLLTLGAEIDGGMTAEAVMLSLTGTQLRQAACDFSLFEPAEAVFDRVVKMKDMLARGFDALARKQPVGTVGQLFRALKERKAPDDDSSH
ncbi:MAG: hypothetical protein K1X64_15000 [Myxococcaceae bacterium]|nr:hypothetical protein [Myxococcaceae bacterium]